MIVVRVRNCGSQGEGSMETVEEWKEQRERKRFFTKDLVFAVSERLLFGVGTLVDIVSVHQGG